jgi:hypothetical protein
MNADREFEKYNEIISQKIDTQDSLGFSISHKIKV